MVMFKKKVYTEFGNLYQMCLDAFKIYIFLM